MPKLYTFFILSIVIIIIINILYTFSIVRVDLKVKYKLFDEKNSILCHYITLPEEIADTDDPSFSPIPGKSIFFLETSCKSVKGESIVTPRQACSIESAARQNPEYEIHLLISGPVTQDNIQDATVRTLLRYKNVKFTRLKIQNYVKNTPLEDLIMTGALEYSNHKIFHTSDVLRLLTLWKYPGIYLDLDVIVAQPLAALGGNWAGKETEKSVANGLLGFGADTVGRNVANMTVYNLRDNFRGSEWSYNGPILMTRVLKQICPEINETTQTTDCKGFKMLNPSYFFPIHWNLWRQYFDPAYLNKVQAMNKTYAFHMWGHLGIQTKINNINGEMPYWWLAQKYCPNVFNLNKDLF